jgi:hypothetical protein
LAHLFLHRSIGLFGSTDKTEIASLPPTGAVPRRLAEEILALA